jgi:signal transduction histidine kinase
LGTLAADSPVADYLHREQQPLTQYDVDLLPRFRACAEEERAWLSDLNMDVYVPIHAKGEWTGLLALGSKVSGDRYFDEDLVLLGTLADQTAMALENARLVEDLIRTNQELGQAYAELNKANRQLQELDKLKSAFIGVITHELRTPFANIIFSLELLERHGQEHLPPELHEQLEQLAEGVKSAKTMVDNLVTFSTFLSKQGELRPTQLNFGQVIENSIVPLESLAEAKQITLHTNVPEVLPPLTGDRERLADAAYHLVHNAIKFTAAGGQVWIRCQATADAVRFEVQDTGVGVPASKLSTLWEDFTQMADPLRRGLEGLGLGLALVKYVVNAHGGDVWADSEEGVGSTFGFCVPVGSVARLAPAVSDRP